MLGDRGGRGGSPGGSHRPVAVASGRHRAVYERKSSGRAAASAEIAGSSCRGPEQHPYCTPYSRAQGIPRAAAGLLELRRLSPHGLTPLLDFSAICRPGSSHLAVILLRVPKPLLPEQLVASSRQRSPRRYAVAACRAPATGPEFHRAGPDRPDAPSGRSTWIEVSSLGYRYRHTFSRVPMSGRPMRISDVLRVKGTQVITVTPDTKVRQLLAVLAEHRIGAVVVSHDGTTVDGIASERDIVQALARRGAAVMSEPVTAICTAEVHTVTAQTPIEEVMRMMTERRVRHVPVVVDGSLQGIVSIGDVVKIRFGELETERTALTEYITGTR